MGVLFRSPPQRIIKLMAAADLRFVAAFNLTRELLKSAFVHPLVKTSLRHSALGKDNLIEKYYWDRYPAISCMSLLSEQ